VSRPKLAMDQRLLALRPIHEELVRFRLAGGGRKHFSTPGMAFSWRQRAYKVRYLLRIREAERVEASDNRATFVDEFGEMQLVLDGSSVIVKFNPEIPPEYNNELPQAVEPDWARQAREQYEREQAMAAQPLQLRTTKESKDE
jgi:hypothetical protein